MFLKTSPKYFYICVSILYFRGYFAQAFSCEVITTRVMQKLLNLDVYREMKLRAKKYDSKVQ
jgi:hypothetical protein